jgi:N6-adenosine-specific RNA methylase IME4
VSGLDLFSPSVVAPPRAGQYQTILADPPWLERGGGQIKRGADRHYQLMPTREIALLPVNAWAAPNAHCYLWVTNNFLEDGLVVLHAWGFRYVTKIDWFKSCDEDVTEDVLARETLHQIGNYIGQHLDRLSAEQLAERIACELGALVDGCDDNGLQVGLGQYFRGVTESCLFGIRGQLPYRTTAEGKRAQGRTGFHAPRGEHSAKPEQLRQMVERVSHGPYLEMFARRPAEGWDLWGIQAPENA